MPSISEMYPSKYLRASDLDGDTVATILHVELREVDEGQSKPTIEFREKHLRPLVCNRTNASAIAKALGSEDTDDWIGKRITLYPTQTEYKGETVDCVRVRIKPPAAKSQAAKPAARDHQRPLEHDMPAGDPGWENGDYR
jgi:hypothetical protein